MAAETKQELLSNIVSICKETSENIGELEADKTLEDPILNDLVKTQKAMGFQLIVDEIKKFKQRKG